MKQVKLKLYIHNVDCYLKGQYDHAFTAIDGDSEWMDNAEEYEYVSTFIIDVSGVDNSELTKKAVNIIDKEIQNERATSEARVTMLERKKSEFLAITFDGGVAK